MSNLGNQIREQINKASEDASAYGSENEDQWSSAYSIACAYEVGILRALLKQLAEAVDNDALVVADDHRRFWLPHWAEGGE